MDLYYLQQKVLNEGAREIGHPNWDSMKRSITESMAKFIEKIALKSLRESDNNIPGQQKLTY
jgi:hypothetical protein